MNYKNIDKLTEWASNAINILEDKGVTAIYLESGEKISMDGAEALVDRVYQETAFLRD